MIYYVKLTKQSDGYLAEFPELSGCFTGGNNRQEALKNSKEALNGWLSSNCDRDLAIPKPKHRRGRSYFPIEVDVRIAFPIILRKVRKERKLSQSQVANKLSISQQAYARLEIPLKSNPSLLTIQKLSKALNTDFHFAFELAA